MSAFILAFRSIGSMSKRGEDGAQLPGQPQTKRARIDADSLTAAAAPSTSNGAASKSESATDSRARLKDTNSDCQTIQMPASCLRTSMSNALLSYGIVCRPRRPSSTDFDHVVETDGDCCYGAGDEDIEVKLLLDIAPGKSLLIPSTGTLVLSERSRVCLDIFAAAQHRITFDDCQSD